MLALSYARRRWIGAVPRCLGCRGLAWPDSITNRDHTSAFQTANDADTPDSRRAAYAYRRCSAIRIDRGYRMNAHCNVMSACVP